MSFSIALIGECMIELQEIAPGDTQQTFGGDTLNAAVYMKRLKNVFPANIDYVTALGTDGFSDKMVQFWEKEGVGSSMVLRQEGMRPAFIIFSSMKMVNVTLVIGEARQQSKNALNTLKAKKSLKDLGVIKVFTLVELV